MIHLTNYPKQDSTHVISTIGQVTLVFQYLASEGDSLSTFLLLLLDIPRRTNICGRRSKQTI